MALFKVLSVDRLQSSNIQVWVWCCLNINKPKTKDLCTFMPPLNINSRLIVSPFEVLTMRVLWSALKVACRHAAVWQPKACEINTFLFRERVVIFRSWCRIITLAVQASSGFFWMKTIFQDEVMIMIRSREGPKDIMLYRPSNPCWSAFSLPNVADASGGVTKMVFEWPLQTLDAFKTVHFLVSVVYLYLYYSLKQNL